ncbi:MAG: hypothetical protein FWG14_12765 [Peptococcaceae bacterium]|nr:hypothetical protein [Peptococcaceae bacterium]
MRFKKVGETMPEKDRATQSVLSRSEAYQLADICKTKPQFAAITPRWITKLMEFKALDCGVYRVNRVIENDTVPDVMCSQTLEDYEIPQGYIAYQTQPREYQLSSVSTIVNVDTKVSDVYNSPFNQVDEQIALAAESLRERQESQLINNPDYGLLNVASAAQHIKTRTGPPTPDDLDELLSKVWKEPSFFLAHPRAVAAFARECTRRGVPPVVAQIGGGNFITWRGIPMIVTDKLFIDDMKTPQKPTGKTHILLIRTGEKKRGVIGLYQHGLPDEYSRGLSVRLRGIDDNGVASYLLSLYCSVAVLADDAIGVLEEVEVGKYYDDE